MLVPLLLLKLPLNRPLSLCLKPNLGIYPISSFYEVHIHSTRIVNIPLPPTLLHGICITLFYEAGTREYTIFFRTFIFVSEFIFDLDLNTNSLRQLLSCHADTRISEASPNKEEKYSGKKRKEGKNDHVRKIF